MRSDNRGIMNKNLLILGAGQYGTVVKEIAKSMGCFEKIDFLDDTFGNGETEGNYHEQSIGKLADYEKFVEEYSYAIVAIGDPEVRKAWTEKLKKALYQIPIIASPKAFVGKTVQLRYGVVVEPMAVVHENVVVGIGTIVSAGAVINHNSFVADYCHIDNNAVVMRGAFVQSMSYVEPLEVVRKVPSKFTIDKDGNIKREDISKRTPVGDGYNFDDVM